MKSTIIFFLAGLCFISCQNNTSKKGIAYTPEFITGFIRDKNALLTQQFNISEESDRFDILTIDVLQSNPKFLPFSVEVLNMKRNRQGPEEAIFRNYQKVHAIADEIMLKQKDQLTLEKEWIEVKKVVMEANGALQTMNADNERRFREFTAGVTGQPMQPSGPRMPGQETPPALR